MRIVRALCLIAMTAPTTPALAQADCQETAGTLAHATGEFEGRSGSDRIRLYLRFTEPKGSGPAVEGVIDDGGRWPVTGSIAPKTCVVTVQTEAPAAVSDTWTLTEVTPSRIAGVVHGADGRTRKVGLTAVAAPRCDGGEPWRTFRSPDWPISFDYPASWDVVASSGDQRPMLSVSCPSLRARLDDSHYVQLERGEGRGTPAYDLEGLTYSRIGWFFNTDGRDWRGGAIPSSAGREMPPSPRTYPLARQSTLAGMPVLQSPMPLPTRTLIRFLFLLPGRWVALEGDPFGEDAAGPGQVILGDDVVSRVVRSVRPTP